MASPIAAILTYRRTLTVIAIVVTSFLLLHASGTTDTARQHISNVLTSQGPWAGSSSAAIAAAEEAELGSTSPRPGSFVKIPETRPGPVGDEILLLMASDAVGNQGNPIPHLHDRSYENKKEYADWHGYTIVDYNFDDFHMAPGVHPIWKKIPAIKRAYEEHPEAEWVLWLDLDVMLMTAALPLSTNLLAPSVLEKKLLRNFSAAGALNRTTSSDTKAEDVNLIFSCDYNGVNAGIMLFRRSEWTEMLLDMWLDSFYIAQTWQSREQDALVHMLAEHDVFWKHTGIVESRALNAYAFNGEDDWHEGDLFVHFAGCWVENECASQWEKFWAMRSPVPLKYLQGVRQFP